MAAAAREWCSVRASWRAPCNASGARHQLWYDDAQTLAAKFAALKAAGVRVTLDDRANYNPGWKYNYWELKGVPLRLELGPKDMAKRQVRLVRRDTGAKEDVPLSVLSQKVALLLVQMQHDLLARAMAKRDAAITRVLVWEDFVPTISQGKLALT